MVVVFAEGERGRDVNFVFIISRLAVIIIVIRLLTLTERATKILNLYLKTGINYQCSATTTTTSLATRKTQEARHND